MKPSGESKLLLGLLAFVALGAGILFFLNRVSQPPPPPPPPAAATAEDFDRLLQDARHVKGPEDAPLAIVEFADFECPACRRIYERLTADFGTKIPMRFAFKHLPLVDQHPRALPAAVAAEAAGRQGKFWEMYDALFDPKAPPLSEEYLEKAARRIGLDLARFNKDRKDPALEELVRADARQAHAHRVESTPSFFVRDPSGTVTRVVGGPELFQLLQEKNLLPADRAKTAGG